MIWQSAFRLLDSGVVPDAFIRMGIRRILRNRLTEQERGGVEGQEERFREVLRALRESAIAVETEKANEQHYEVPPEFFQLVLGKRLKYSSGYWPEGPGGIDGLDEAEEAMLRMYSERARIDDGMENPRPRMRLGVSRCRSPRGIPGVPSSPFRTPLPRGDSSRPAPSSVGSRTSTSSPRT